MNHIVAHFSECIESEIFTFQFLFRRPVFFRADRMLFYCAASLLIALATAGTTNTPIPYVPSALNQWSAWTPCGDTTCQVGSETRTRSFVTPSDALRTDCPVLYASRCVTADCIG